MSQHALFEGLIVTPDSLPVTVAYVGGAAQYVVPDGDFKFHLDAESVDRQVLKQLGEQIAANKDAVTEGALKMMGQDDLFSKAMLEASLNNMEANFARLIAEGLPESARTYLGMIGFRVTVNYHGEVVNLNQPGLTATEDE